MGTIQDIIRQSIKDKSEGDINPARRNLDNFAEIVFKDPNGDPIKLKSFHKDMLGMMQNLKRVLILSPRGSGKSSLASSVYPSFRIMQNRDIRIIIVSNTIDLAKEWLRSIERTMTQNEEYIRLTGGDFVPGHKDSGIWTDTEKVIKGRSPFATHVTLRAVGVRGSLLGKRADLIIADDILDPENTATPYQRQLVSNWFNQVLLPILDPQGQIIVIGTRFARGDLYEELWEAWNKEKDGKKIVPDAGCIKIVAEPEEGVSYWPERFSIDYLNAIKHTNSLSYWSQYMNEPVDMTGAFLKREWIEKFYENLPVGKDGIPNVAYYVGMDPSITGKGDCTGIVVVGVQTGSNKIYVVEVIREKADLEKQTQLLEAVCARYRPVIVNVEANAAQQLFTQFLEKTTMLPINQSQTRTDKAARFANLAAHFQNGRIALKGHWEAGVMRPDEGMDILIEEWCGFRPKDAQDDALDALEKAVEVAAYVTDPIEDLYNPPKYDFENNFNRKRNFKLFR